MIGTFFLIALLPLLVLAKSGSYGGTHSFSSSHVGTGAKSEHEYVSGYTKNNGTHVNGYDRSTRDDTKNNNWSTKGNTNPETGKAGTKSGD
jgi:hypothetical protein